MPMNKQEVDMLREEIELLMQERTHLLKAVGAAAVLVANSDAKSFPKQLVDAAQMLSDAINTLPEETLKDALDSVQAKIE